MRASIAERIDQEIQGRVDKVRSMAQRNLRLKKRSQARQALFAQNPQFGSTSRTQRGRQRGDTSQQGLLTAPNSMPSLLGDM